MQYLQLIELAGYAWQAYFAQHWFCQDNLYNLCETHPPAG